MSSASARKTLCNLRSKHNPSGLGFPEASYPAGAWALQAEQRAVSRREGYSLTYPHWHFPRNSCTHTLSCALSLVLT